MRKTILFCAVLLLGGCLKYRISVETTVGIDGTVRRVLTVRELDEQETWRQFGPPRAPYKMEGDDEDGFVANARHGFGTHGNGIRRLMAKNEGDYEGAEATKGKPKAEGTVAVHGDDLIVGTLYTYHERIALGVDPVRCRREMPVWIERMMKVGFQGLRNKFKDVDFAPAEALARKTYLPLVKRAALGIHQALLGLLADYRMQGYPDEPDAWLKNPHARIIRAELEALGFGRKKDAPDARTLDDFFENDAWAFDTRHVDALVAVLKCDEKKRAEIRATMLEPEGEHFEAAAQELFPKLEEEFESFIVAALGAWITYGFGDNHKLKFALRMPGHILKTNGEITGVPLIRWELADEDLVLRSPELSAHSFLPVEGVPADGAWRLSSLIALRKTLAERDKDKLRKLFREALKSGWDGVLKKVADDADKKALEELRDVLTEVAE